MIWIYCKYDLNSIAILFKYDLTKYLNMILIYITYDLNVFVF